MTGIVLDYKRGVVCYDSRLTRGGTILTDDYEKSKKLGDDTYIFSGMGGDVEKFINAYPDLESIEGDLRCYGAVIRKGEVYSFCFEDGYREFKCEFSEAWGCARDHLLTAIDCGCTAEEAMQKAIKRDTGCGGKIRTIHVKPAK